jgi:hypothetical protein
MFEYFIGGTLISSMTDLRGSAMSLTLVASLLLFCALCQGENGQGSGPLRDSGSSSNNEDIQGTDASSELVPNGQEARCSPNPFGGVDCNPHYCNAHDVRTRCDAHNYSKRCKSHDCSCYHEMTYHGPSADHAFRLTCYRTRRVTEHDVCWEYSVGND